MTSDNIPLVLLVQRFRQLTRYVLGKDVEGQVRRTGAAVSPLKTRRAVTNDFLWNVCRCAFVCALEDDVFVTGNKLFTDFAPLFLYLPHIHAVFLCE